MSTTHLALAAALRHAHDGAWEPVLASLLEAWRGVRAAEIAEVIELVSVRVTRGVPPLRGTNRKTTTEPVWNAAAAEQRPALLERLLEGAPDVRWRHERLRVIREMPPDPRIPAWAARTLAVPLRDNSVQTGFYDGLVAILDAYRDPRLLPSVEALVAAEARDYLWGVPRRSHAALEAHLDVLRTLAAPRLDAEQRAALDAVREVVVAAPRVDPTPFFAAVYANPADDDARAVLGDLLQQRGDPRGELIALQLATAAGKRRSPRETQLLRTWGRDWRGALADALEDVVYERGFPARGRLRGWEAKETIGRPEWATISHLDMQGYPLPQLLTSRVMRSLRHVTCLPGRMPLVLAHDGPFPWTTLGLGVEDWGEVGESLPPDVIAAFPRVRSLVLAERLLPVHGPADALAALVARWPALVELDVPIASAEIATFLSHPASARLQRVVVREHTGLFAFDRAAKRITVVAASRSFWVAAIIGDVAPLRSLGIVETVEFRFTSRMGEDEERFLAFLRARGDEAGLGIIAYRRRL